MNRDQAIAYAASKTATLWGHFFPPEGWIWSYEGRTLTLASIDGYSPIFLEDVPQCPST